MVAEKDTSLTIVRRIKAPREAVFNAWTDAKELMQWMAPGDAMKVALAQSDPRVGGRYRIVMREPDGVEHRVGGVYREVVRHARLVFTWAWESTPERESLVEVAFNPIGAETELVLTHTRFADTPARDRHLQGWNGCLDNLLRWVNSSAAQRIA